MSLQPPCRRGETVWLTIGAGEPIEALVILASANGLSLALMFDGTREGHAGVAIVNMLPDLLHGTTLHGVPVCVEQLPRGRPS